MATIQVPASAAMAVQLRSVAKHEEDERAEIKRLVLKANKDLDLAGSAGAVSFHTKEYNISGIPCLAEVGQDILWLLDHRHMYVHTLKWYSRERQAWCLTHTCLDCWRA